MNIRTITKLLTDAGIEENEAKIEIKMLLEHFCKFTALDIAKGNVPDDEQLTILYDKVQERITTRLPVQYIIGEAYFMGEFFKVNSSVLIPRDETELLVRSAIELIRQYGYKDVLDIGTGSGCIACTIAKQTHAVVLGIDISSEALRTALDNASKLNLNNRAIFRKSDIFSNVKEGETFDMIVSNPPYIPPSEKERIQEEVKFDPEIALFTKDEKGLEFYEKITKEAIKVLNKGGYLMYELGIGQSEDVKRIMQEVGFTKIEIQKDLAGIDRIIYGVCKE